MKYLLFCFPCTLCYHVFMVFLKLLIVGLQSFVKRVANRVSELLPQPTWLSRWMSPAAVPNAADFTNHMLSSTVVSRPMATSRADLNLADDVDHQNPPAKKPRTNQYHSPINQKFLKGDLYGE